MEDWVAQMARSRQEHLAAIINTGQKQSWKTTTDLKVGDEVLTWVEHRKNKLMERWRGPEKIVWIGEKGAVKIKGLHNQQEKLVAGHKVKKFWRSLDMNPKPMESEAQQEAREKRPKSSICMETERLNRLKQ